LKILHQGKEVIGTHAQNQEAMPQSNKETKL
jgi:hypothetical protein